jgi:hypothetical protein
MNISKLGSSLLWQRVVVGLDTNVSEGPENGCSKILRNVGILPQFYTASQPRTPPLESSPQWKLQISRTNMLLDIEFSWKYCLFAAVLAVVKNYFEHNVMSV